MYKSSREQVIHSVIFKDFFKVLAKAFLTPLKTQTKSIKIMSFFRLRIFVFAVLRKNEIISLCWNKCVNSYQNYHFCCFAFISIIRKIETLKKLKKIQKFKISTIEKLEKFKKSNN